MKACKLCEILDHQQKLSGEFGLGNNTETSMQNSFCSHHKLNTDDHHGNQTSPNKSSTLSSSFGMLPPYLKDMFVAAHLIRGKTKQNIQQKKTQRIIKPFYTLIVNCSSLLSLVNKTRIVRIENIIERKVFH